jgi:ssRNA-specific RNase YbeY (16S rRNA maturation enzyme)
MAASVQVHVEEPFAAGVSPGRLKTAAEVTLEAEGHSTGELTLVITDDESLRALNRAHLGIDAPTDVLSFGGQSPEFVSPPSVDKYLGDVVIAYPQAKKQSSAAGPRRVASAGLRSRALRGQSGDVETARGNTVSIGADPRAACLGRVGI